MEDNLYFWDKLRTPPADALKPIRAGRLKGNSDISPQWRLEALTAVFGPIGIGWTYRIDRLWTEPGSDGQVAAFAMISMKIKVSGEWSEDIPGIGGSMFVVNESRGPHTSDECYKMAVTDALSVAMKEIGVAADVYRGGADGSKYSRPQTPQSADRIATLRTEITNMLAAEWMPADKRDAGRSFLARNPPESKMVEFRDRLVAMKAEAENAPPPETPATQNATDDPPEPDGEYRPTGTW